jgi:hypothetical protein
LLDTALTDLYEKLAGITGGLVFLFVPAALGVGVAAVVFGFVMAWIKKARRAGSQG